MRPLLATYRLQFREGMDFQRAAELAPYLGSLGISHLYVSPIFSAAPGSTHGYDIADFNTLEPALGGEEGFALLHDALRAHGLALILDFVPNHMAATPHNRWWRDVLEWGEKSRHAHVFDIDWTMPKLVVPALGEPYGRVLERGELSLAFDPADGGLSMVYYDLKLPLTPPTYAQVFAAEGDSLTDFANRFAVANDETAPALKQEIVDAAQGRRVRAAIESAARSVAEDTDKLHTLHESQTWRLMHWRAARELLTYRRFFEIADLVGVRMEQPSVFDESHALVLQLAREGKIDGLRLDHVDGVADPKSYFGRLQEELPGDGDFLLLVEKILGPGEQLRTDWPVAGTTGYEFIFHLAGLFTDPAGEAALSEAYDDFIGEPMRYAELVFQTKRRIFTRNLAGELDFLTRLAIDLAAADLLTRDLGPDTLRRAIIEIATALPVYRTYVDVEGPREQDLALIEDAAAKAKTTREVEDETAIDFIAGLVKLDMSDPERRASALLFATRFQQTTGPLMAKAVEDTLFYRYNRLIALNEVGGEPDVFGAPVDAFHRAMQERRARQPLGLLTTATHDTKRGEDARARLYAISETPGDWRDAVMRWHDHNARLVSEVAGAAVPARNDEWLFYQALLGAWLPDLRPRDAPALSALADRMVAFMQKAEREAKLMTSWTAPAQDYEAALESFVRGALDPGRSEPFLTDFVSAIGPFIRAGAVTSLAQTLIKLTAPGVPDIYQGSELWDLSLVDPDNRRPVDFSLRADLLSGNDPLAIEAAHWRDGRLKLALIRTGLELRRREPGLFAEGDYVPLAIEGASADNAFAFARMTSEAALIVVVPRRPLALLGEDDDTLIDPALLGDTALALPRELAALCWRNLFADGHAAPGAKGRMTLSVLFERLPFALLASGM